jgi:DNA-binding response OmpR family regulator
MLIKSGFDCDVSNNGKDGLELVMKNSYDVVLLDLAMPEMTGLDILKNIKKERMLHKQKTILFTASPIYSDAEIEKLKDEFLISDRIRKPFSRQELVEAIKRNLTEAKRA